MLRTRIFDLMYYHGYRSQAELARKMGKDPASLSRVKTGQLEPDRAFIMAAIRAFPGKTYEDLFYEEREAEPVEVAGG